MESFNTIADSNSPPELEIDRTANVDDLLNDDVEMLDTENLSTDGVREGYLQLSSGRALSLHETYGILARENAVITVLIGPSACGKTTIETTLYQLFQRDKVNGFLFAGSKTLQGYEERSFYTRINSREKIASTPRTIQKLQEVFLHLRLLDKRNNQKINYLLADLSGEEIQAYIADVNSLTQNMSFIRHTDNYTIVLDGERLADKLQRNGVIEEAASMIRTIFDAGLFSSLTKAQLVISKYDVIKTKDDSRTEQYLQKNIHELECLIFRYINNVTIHRVAAMPDGGDLTVGFGLEELLTAWDYIPSYTNMDSSYDVGFTIESEFNKLRFKLAGVTNG